MCHILGFLILNRNWWLLIERLKHLFHIIQPGVGRDGSLCSILASNSFARGPLCIIRNLPDKYKGLPAKAVQDHLRCGRM